MRLRRLVSVVVVLTTFVAGCADEDDDIAAPDDDIAAPDDDIAEAGASSDDDDDSGHDPADASFDGLSIVDTGAPDGFDEVVVSIGPEDASFLFVARGADLDDEVEFLGIVTPDGGEVLPDDLISPTQRGELAVLLPLRAGSPLVAGDYVVTVRSARGVRGTTTVFKRAPSPLQAIDVTFALVSEVALEAEQSQLDTLADRYRTDGETVFAPHGLGVGNLAFERREDLVDDFGELPLPTSGTDTEQRRLCRALAGDASRRFVIAVVDSIVDPDDADGETEGNAAGLPGATVVADASTGCVIVQADGSRPIVELSATVWHEAGHAMGLAHTTEAGGDEFDLLDDTPECDFTEFDTNFDDYVDATECPDGGNLMFHDSDALAITDAQAFVLRHHPLFRRLEAHQVGALVSATRDRKILDHLQALSGDLADNEEGYLLHVQQGRIPLDGGLEVDLQDPNDEWHCIE